jgi:hypothetical protein
VVVVLATALSQVIGGGPALPRNELEAQAVARSLIAGLGLPPGAVRWPVEPSGGGAALAHASQTFGVPGYTAYAHAWWIVPTAPRWAMFYANTRSPATGTMGPAVSGSSEVKAFTLPASSDAITVEGVSVTAKWLPDGKTGVRADAQVGWLPPRPAAERIPAGTRRLLLRVASPTTYQYGQYGRAIPITSQTQIRKVVALLNRLLRYPPGMSFGCGGPTQGPPARLTFYGDRGTRPLALATVDPGNCPWVQLTIAGHTEPLLSGEWFSGAGSARDTHSVTTQLSSIVHIQLPTHFQLSTGFNGRP